jgi:hypothetical protein
MYTVCFLLPVGRVDSKFLAGTEFYFCARLLFFLPFSPLDIMSLVVQVCFEFLTLGLSPDESTKEPQHHEQEQEQEPQSSAKR